MQNNINDNIAIYDKICVDYIAETFDKFNQEAVEKFLSNVDGTEKILELGTGSGNNLTYMFGQGKNIHGSDNVLGFYEWITTRFACPFSLIDFADVRFVNSFVNDYDIDHLFCNLALQHLSHEEFLFFIQRVKFKGVFYFSLYDGRGESYDEQGIFSAYYKHRQVTKLLEERFDIKDHWFSDDTLGSDKKMLNYIVKLK